MFPSTTTSFGRMVSGRPIAQQAAALIRGMDRRALSVSCGESRIGKQPVTIPSGVQVKLDGRHFKAKGPKGELEFTFPNDVSVEQNGSIINFTRITSTKKSKAMHGLARALCNNMLIGVSQGFERKLQMIGVGYRAAVTGKTLTLSVGYCHPVVLDIPEGVKAEVIKNTEIVLTGYDKMVVGNFAANIRKTRPPEPYKGKGIRYHDEIVRRKEGKSGK